METYKQDKEKGTIQDLAQEDCTILSTNAILAHEFIKNLFDKIGKINKIITDIMVVVSRDDVISKILVNEIAWLADNTIPDHYGWEIEAHGNLCYLLYHSYSLSIELINGEQIDLNSIFTYKCSKNSFEDENIETTHEHKKRKKKSGLTEEEMEFYLNLYNENGTNF